MENVGFSAVWNWINSWQDQRPEDILHLNPNTTTVKYRIVSKIKKQSKTANTNVRIREAVKVGNIFGFFEFKRLHEFYWLYTKACGP